MSQNLQLGIRGLVGLKSAKQLAELSSIVWPNEPATRAWEAERWESFLNQGTVTAWGLTALREGGTLPELIASLVLQAIAPDEVEIITLLTHPEFRRQQLAQSLLKMAFARFNQHRFLLEVEEDNHPACRLYLKLGFVVTGNRPDYYGPHRHALIMAREAYS